MSATDAQILKRFEPHTPGRSVMLAYLAVRMMSGHRVVIATEEAADIGVPIGRCVFGFLVVKRRATKEEFIAQRPKDIPKSDQEPERLPFYYELELHEE